MCTICGILNMLGFLIPIKNRQKVKPSADRFFGLLNSCIAVYSLNSRNDLSSLLGGDNIGGFALHIADKACQLIPEDMVLPYRILLPFAESSANLHAPAAVYPGCALSKETGKVRIASCVTAEGYCCCDAIFQADEELGMPFNLRSLRECALCAHIGYDLHRFGIYMVEQLVKEVGAVVHGDATTGHFLI